MPQDPSDKAAQTISRETAGVVATGGFAAAIWIGLGALGAIAAGWGVLSGQYAGMSLAMVMIAASALAIRIWRPGRHARLLLLFLAAVSLFHVWYVVAGPFDLSGDECQYWDWSRHMDWSFSTKGPGVAAILYVSRLLFGETPLAVRGPAVVLSFLSSLLLLRLGRKLVDEKSAAMAAALFQIVPAYAVYSVGMNTDPPLIFFWLAALWLVAHACGTGVSPAREAGVSPAGACQLPRWPWLLMGVMVGLGFLSKYTMALFYPCLLLYLLSSRDRRRHLATVWPYAAVAVGLAVMSPVFLWNMQHGWVNFRHNFTHVAAATAGGASQPPPTVHPLASLGNFVGSQLGIVTPILLALMIWALLRRRREEAISFWFSIPLLAMFLVKSFFGKAEANWALTAYLTGFLAFAAVCLRDFRLQNVHVRRLTVAAVLIAVAGTAIVHNPMPLMSLWRPAASSLAKLIHIDPHKLGADADPMKKVRGWANLAAEVDRVRPADGRPYFVLSDNYMISSALAFYCEGNPRTYCMNRGRRMNQFDLWPGFGGFVGQDAVYVRAGNSVLPNELKAAFDSYEKRQYVKPLDPFGNDFTVFVCHGFKGMELVLPDRY